jgi:transposase-like protein
MNKLEKQDGAGRRDGDVMTAESAQSTQAKQEIAAAWNECQQTERCGIEFGRVCYQWRETFKSKAGCKSKGKGIRPILKEFGIPTSTAYFWIKRYESSIGVKRPTPAPKSVFEELSKVLNTLVPSITDGVEHKTITLIQEASDRVLAQDLTKQEEEHRKEVVFLLNKISKDFAIYAQMLSQSGTVQ